MSALGQNQTFSREHYNLPLESVVVHHNKVEPPMSALGQKRTSRHLQPMSALPPKADITERGWYVRFVPKADILHCSIERRYSITSSARVMSDCGRSRPIARAALRLNGTGLAQGRVSPLDTASF